MCVFCRLPAANAVFALQDLLRRDSSEFGPVARDPFYVLSAGARWVYGSVPFVTTASALAILLPAAFVLYCLCQQTRETSCTDTVVGVQCPSGFLQPRVLPPQQQLTICRD